MNFLNTTVFISLSFFSFHLFASDIFQVRVEKVDHLSGHQIDFEWELTTQHGTILKLVCPGNKVAYKETPHILYFGHANQYVGRFAFNADNKCNQLNEFIRGVHYRVDPINPIILKFSRSKKEVRSIIFPELDPYDLSPKSKFGNVIGGI